MVPARILLLGAALWVLTPPSHAEASRSQDQPRPDRRPVTTIEIVGAEELDRESILQAGRLRLGEPLPEPVDGLADAVEDGYRNQGFSFAEVSARFDEATGVLTLTVDEGRIDEVEFTGVDEARARSLAADFAMRAGDVFNRSRAADALRALLRPTRGAISPARRAFDIVRRNGRRVLVVDVTERAGTFRTTIAMGEREDWFTPVDGLVPSLGFAGAVFDQVNFNHAYIAAHVSFKTATRDAGYSIGFERPLFRPVTVYVGAELFDLTATDDTWQVSGTQASLAAVTVRTSLRDYYQRRGVQLHTAFRPNPHLEFQFAWRGERHETLATSTDFSIWNRDDRFRPNTGASTGKLNALVFGAAFDSFGYQDDSLQSTYRRHLLTTPFGRSLRDPGDAPGQPVWRVEWNSEVSTPGGLGSDFDFHRHIVNARTLLPLSSHEEVRARVIGGWSGGVLPPQRTFALGGIGTVHGYGFKEAAGDNLVLFNVEYAVGRLNGPHIVPFFDAGRVSSTTGAQWLRGVGFGLGLTRDIRVDFGYKLNDIPGSLQVLLRLGRTF
jgi:outer membrane protein assembly factor BamA